MDDAFDDLLEANARYAAVAHEVADSGVARKRLAIVTCIDSRIDPLAVFGLEPGDAKILRNAGARITDDVERSLALATATLGVTRIAVVQHTDCKLTAVSDAELVDAVAEATGRAPQDFEPLAITDHAEALKGDVARLLVSPLLPGGTVVAGLLYDLRSGRLDVVEPAAAV
jgi:carbonic anhydrase